VSPLIAPDREPCHNGSVLRNMSVHSRFSKPAFCLPRKGQLKIAQHFSAGSRPLPSFGAVPEGRPNPIQSRPQSSLRDFNDLSDRAPALKCWAILGCPFETPEHQTALLGCTEPDLHLTPERARL
jgi:hypothetical protein